MSREKFLLSSIVGCLLIVALRLYYWQIVKGNTLQKVAEKQSERQIITSGNRGKIYTSDGYLLVGNQEYYRLYAEPPQITTDKKQLSEQIADFIVQNDSEYLESTDEARKKEIVLMERDQLREKLQSENKWVSLATKISLETKQKIEQLQANGLGFEPFTARYYPEASMAAHLTGFVGKNDEGKDIGYFGVEGVLNNELTGKTRKRVFNTDALGFLLAGQNIDNTNNDGRDITLTIQRDLQYSTEKILKKGIERYGAKNGEIIIMDPKTGKILAMATWPTYDQEKYFDFDTEMYKNPVLTHVYEPGSTFKTLTVSAGIDAGVINPDTLCDSCAGPRKIDKYTIRTWNNEYHPNISMTEALEKSDNTAMIFITEKLGGDTFVQYLKKFKIGDSIGIDLQEDTNTPFPQKWGPVELATTSFGQGISTTSLQMVRAVGSIANKGVMMKPTIVEKVYDHQTGKEIITHPMEENRTISEETAQKVTQMMVSSALHGEAQWIAAKHYTVAGKTGTSQIAIQGGYAEEGTIASFIGFAPPEDPQFVMMVKLVEPSSSPWAAETAAPLWFEVAQKVFFLLNIPPDK